MKLKQFRITGACLVPAQVETIIIALNKEDADRIARERFKGNIKKMFVDPEITSAYEFEVHHIDELTEGRAWL